MELEGKVALVTGGGRGIGRATALALAAAGCDVAVLARTSIEVEQVAAEVRQLGRRGVALSADLADLATIAGVVTQLREQLGPVALLVNNAAVVEPIGASVGVDLNQWAQALTINLTSVFGLIQAVLPDMLTANWGRIVAVSSGIASGNGMTNMNAYSVSKAGLEMLVRNLAVELAGSGVTVNAVRPGTVDTAMQAHIRIQPVERVGQTIHESFAGFHARGALRAPEEPARLIVQVLAGDASGEVISIGDARSLALLERAR